MNITVSEANKKLIKKFGAFYASCKESYDSQKITGIQYVGLEGDVICPEDNVKELVTALKSLDWLGPEDASADLCGIGVTQDYLRKYREILTTPVRG